MGLNVENENGYNRLSLENDILKKLLIMKEARIFINYLGLFLG